MSFFKRTGLGRHMDWRRVSNRLAFLLPAVAGAISLLWDFAVNDDFAIFEAARAGVAVFLAWAIAREVDPDREWVAYLAMPLSLAVSIGHSPNLIVCSVALVGIRTLVGTVGRRITVVDHMVLLVGAGLAALSPVGWPVAILVVVATQVAGGPFANWWALASAGLGVAVAFFFGESPPSVQEAELGGYLPLVFIVLAVLLARIGYVRTLTDSGRRPLARGRLRSGRMAAALIVAFASAIEGLVGVALVGPVLAAAVPAAVAPASERRQRSGPVTR